MGETAGTWTDGGQGSKEFQGRGSKVLPAAGGRADGPGTAVRCVSVTQAEDRMPWNLGTEVKE